MIMKFLPIATIAFVLMAGGHVYQAWRIDNYKQENAELRTDVAAWEQSAKILARQYQKRDEAIARREKDLQKLNQDTEQRLKQLREAEHESDCINQPAGIAVISSLRGEAPETASAELSGTTERND